MLNLFIGHVPKDSERLSVFFFEWERIKNIGNKNIRNHKLWGMDYNEISL